MLTAINPKRLEAPRVRCALPGYQTSPDREERMGAQTSRGAGHLMALPKSAEVQACRQP
jgi:hypothetical protein